MNGDSLDFIFSSSVWLSFEPPPTVLSLSLQGAEVVFPFVVLFYFIQSINHEIQYLELICYVKLIHDCRRDIKVIAIKVRKVIL